MTLHDTPVAAPDVHTAEAIPPAAKAEVECLLASGDLFRYTSDNAPVALLEAEFSVYRLWDTLAALHQTYDLLLLPTMATAAQRSSPAAAHHRRRPSRSRRQP